MDSFSTRIRDNASLGFTRTVLFPESADERVRSAAKKLSKDGSVRPLFVCAKDDRDPLLAEGFETLSIEREVVEELTEFLIKARASKVGTPDELTKEKAHTLALDPLFYAMYLLHKGEVDGLVAGATRPTAEVIRAGLWIVGKADGIKTVSSSFYMVIPAFRGNAEEVLTFTDCAVVPNPSPEQLSDIAFAASEARKSIVGDTPHVAFLSYSTKGSGSGASVDSVREAVKVFRNRYPDISMDGEFQVDAALIDSIAKRKAPESLIGGKANVLVFPSLDAGNIAYKLVEQLVPGAEAIGPILQGMKKPVSDLSRGATSDDIMRTALIVAAQAKR